MQLGGLDALVIHLAQHQLPPDILREMQDWNEEERRLTLELIKALDVHREYYISGLLHPTTRRTMINLAGVLGSATYVLKMIADPPVTESELLCLIEIM